MRRLLRVIKVTTRLSNLVKQITSNELLLFLGLLGQIVSLVAVTQQTWVEAHSQLKDPHSTFMKYIVSLQWSVSNFHGNTRTNPMTALETAFATCAVILALVFVSWFVARMTNAIMNLQSLHHGRTVDMRMLMDFLNVCGVSAPLSWRVRLYVEKVIFQQEEERKGFEPSVRFLSHLPDHLMKDLHHEVRKRYLEGHDFFSELSANHPLVVRSICHEAFQQLVMDRGEVVFNKGDECNRMIFIEFGMLDYAQGTNPIPEDTPHSVMAPTLPPSPVSSWSCAGGSSISLKLVDSWASRKHLKRTSWISEVALWAIWANSGTSEAFVSTVILALDAHDFAILVKFSKNAFLEAVSYATAFVQTANRAGCTDLGTSEPVQLQMDSEESDVTDRSTLRRSI